MDGVCIDLILLPPDIIIPVVVRWVFCAGVKASLVGLLCLDAFLSHSLRWGHNNLVGNPKAWCHWNKCSRQAEI